MAALPEDINERVGMVGLFKKASVPPRPAPSSLTQIGISGKEARKGACALAKSYNCKLRNMTALAGGQFRRNVIRREVAFHGSRIRPGRKCKLKYATALGVACLLNPPDVKYGGAALLFNYGSQKTKRWWRVGLLPAAPLLHLRHSCTNAMQTSCLIAFILGCREAMQSPFRRVLR